MTENGVGYGLAVVRLGAQNVCCMQSGAAHGVEIVLVFIRCENCCIFAY